MLELIVKRDGRAPRMEQTSKFNEKREIQLSKSNGYSWNKMLAVYFSLLLLTQVYARDISSFNSRNHESSQTNNLNDQSDNTNRFSVNGNHLTRRDYSEMTQDSSTPGVEISSTTTQSTAAYSTDDGNTHPIRRLDKKRLRSGTTRGKRHTDSANGGELKRRSCQTKVQYDFKEKATDMFGHKVQVYPYIHIGNLSIDQYFYESFCDAEKCECSGIDNKKFKSSCETDYTYTYAKVIKSGEIGWTHIKIRSGCSCKIHKVDAHRSLNIMDFLK